MGTDRVQQSREDWQSAADSRGTIAGAAGCDGLLGNPAMRQAQ